MSTFTVPAELVALRGVVPPRVRAFLWVLVIIGIVTFIVLWLTDHQRLWFNYLANFLYFTGLCQAGVVWSAVTRGCNGRWARPLQRMAEGLAAALPLSCLLFIPLMLAHATIWPWWDHPPSRKLPWLSHGFLLSRDIGLFVGLTVLSCIFLYTSIKPDLERDRGGLTAAGSPAAAAAQRRLSRLWVLLVFAFCYFYAVLGMDLNMSLNPNWYDYIWGWFFFISTWYPGCALISVLAILWRRHLRVEHVITADVLHDNGELTFAFAIFWAYQFWAQFMVLWFANRRDDIRLLIRLQQQHPWLTLSWVTLALGFFLPFGFGLCRSYKRRGATLAYIAALSLAGLWLQQNVIVDASLWHRGFPPLITSGLLGCGFLGAYGLCYLWLMQRVPFFPVRDPVMHEALVWHPPRH